MTELPTAPLETTPRPSRTRLRRRLIIGIAAALVAALAVVIGSQFAPRTVNANAVVRYTSKAEHYSVKAPGKPTQEKAVAGALPTTITHWIDGERYYSVSSAENADVPPSQRGLVLHELLTGGLKDAPGVSASALESQAVLDAFLSTPKQITLSGDPAFLTPLTVKGAPAPFHVVFTGHGSTLYMLVFSVSAGSRDEDFLKSFTYLD